MIVKRCLVKVEFYFFPVYIICKDVHCKTCGKWGKVYKIAFCAKKSTIKQKNPFFDNFTLF